MKPDTWVNQRKHDAKKLIELQDNVTEKYHEYKNTEVYYYQAKNELSAEIAGYIRKYNVFAKSTWVFDEYGLYTKLVNKDLRYIFTQSGPIVAFENFEIEYSPADKQVYIHNWYSKDSDEVYDILKYIIEEFGSKIKTTPGMQKLIKNKSVDLYMDQLKIKSMIELLGIRIPESK